jgi:release factor glutamine methyltransferase
MAENTAPVKDALQGAVDSLTAAGVDSPKLDAELLLEEATGWTRERLATEPEATLPPGASRKFSEMIRRRVRREPVAYILGRKGFRGLELELDSRVLIPRPETELLVEIALELRPTSVVDVGTGSGAVALAVAAELPDAEVLATDTSRGALELARENATRLGLAGRVRFDERSLPDGGRWDLVLANLPYVSEAEWDELDPEITRYEPRSALVAGTTGLEAIDALLGELSVGPLDVGSVALEVGAGQAPSVADLVRRAGFEQVETLADLAGIDRVVVGRG